MQQDQRFNQAQPTEEQIKEEEHQERYKNGKPKKQLKLQEPWTDEPEPTGKKTKKKQYINLRF